MVTQYFAVLQFHHISFIVCPLNLKINAISPPHEYEHVGSALCSSFFPSPVPETWQELDTSQM